MSKTLKTLGLTIFFAVLAWMPLMAQEGGAPDTKSKLYMLSLIVAGAVITLAAAAGAFCQAKAIS
nr:hypothetical protein [Candidatus Aminicenantes bacterium]